MTVKNIKFIPVSLVTIAIILIGFVIWWLDHSPRTTDAYVYADQVSVIPEVSGKIIELKTKDNALVKKGDVLFKIDPRPFQYALDASNSQLNVLDQQINMKQRTINSQKFNAKSINASVEAARANEKQAADILRRLEPLLGQGFASAEEVERAKSTHNAAKAQLEAALLQGKTADAGIQGVEDLVAQKAVIEAQMQMQKLQLEHTVLKAPFNARIVSLDTQEGQVVSPSKPVFTLINAEEWFVIANFRESDLKGIESGTPAEVFLTTDKNKKYEAIVDSIGWGVKPDDGTALFGGLPSVKKSINWVHVLQRFPVKIKVKNPDKHLFRLGASATVIIKK
ncbi:multidrug transporter subunit MdtN [Acinetobacter faecalis]|uniref:multidrug transporter subunit MdtN n=1 Tax=Acinetobacter faecalis TaxID=2665161 RepID=UPI002A91481F|nr:multidrug transporter subunit MdtN [Acinetobacter faecalis]MDY6457336.1 multidrug transporter subunit MdtN [Acinetobacter faecalis]MDY6469307.1 multidrug transporter subunit MdtN [Acinetobacter faecalis]